MSLNKQIVLIHAQVRVRNTNASICWLVRVEEQQKGERAFDCDAGGTER